MNRDERLEALGDMRHADYIDAGVHILAPFAGSQTACASGRPFRRYLALAIEGGVAIGGLPISFSPGFRSK